MTDPLCCYVLSFSPAPAAGGDDFGEFSSASAPGPAPGGANNNTMWGTDSKLFSLDGLKPNAPAPAPASHTAPAAGNGGNININPFGTFFVHSLPTANGKVDSGFCLVIVCMCLWGAGGAGDALPAWLWILDSRRILVSRSWTLLCHHLCLINQPT